MVEIRNPLGSKIEFSSEFKSKEEAESAIVKLGKRGKNRDIYLKANRYETYTRLGFSADTVRKKLNTVSNGLLYKQTVHDMREQRDGADLKLYNALFAALVSGGKTNNEARDKLEPLKLIKTIETNRTEVTNGMDPKEAGENRGSLGLRMGIPPETIEIINGSKDSMEPTDAAILSGSDVSDLEDLRRSARSLEIPGNMGKAPPSSKKQSRPAGDQSPVINVDHNSHGRTTATTKAQGLAMLKQMDGMQAAFRHLATEMKAGLGKLKVPITELPTTKLVASKYVNNIIEELEIIKIENKGVDDVSIFKIALEDNLQIAIGSEAILGHFPIKVDGVLIEVGTDDIDGDAPVFLKLLRMREKGFTSDEILALTRVINENTFSALFNLDQVKELSWDVVRTTEGISVNCKARVTSDTDVAGTTVRATLKVAFTGALLRQENGKLGWGGVQAVSVQ